MGSSILLIYELVSELFKSYLEARLDFLDLPDTGTINMWLINTSTLTLEHVLQPDACRFAILSHTWEKDEVSFQDMAFPARAKQKAGFSKIEWTCKLALLREIKYAWVDTCCINKRSSAELTEAINSMFHWYKISSVCFVFLSDLQPQHENHEWLNRAMLPCRWFTRGWTLQELIAPEVLEFYDRDWNFRGTKVSLRAEIADITGIDAAILGDGSLLHTVSIAKRMSWAAYRQTTRDEDRAYSLLGIFDVNMPMLYGEGGVKAFFRLQEEIMKVTNDLTLFAWTTQLENRKDLKALYPDHHSALRGVLARSPLEFANCRHIERARTHIHNREFTITNNGLRIEAFLPKGENSSYILGLDSTDKSLHTNYTKETIGIYLMKTPTGFVRLFSDRLCLLKTVRSQVGLPSTIHIKRDITLEQSKRLPTQFMQLHIHLPTHYHVESSEANPHSLWDPHRDRVMVIPGGSVLSFFSIDAVDMTSLEPIHLVVLCGLEWDEIASRMKPWGSVYANSTRGSEDNIDILTKYRNRHEDVEMYALRQLLFPGNPEGPSAKALQRLTDKKLILHEESNTKTQISLRISNEEEDSGGFFHYYLESALIPEPPLLELETLRADPHSYFPGSWAEKEPATYS